MRDDGAAPDREPDLILLDLNLPGMDGCQVLTRIKSDPFLRMIPVVILTTSDREEDILQTYQAGANTYISKPDEYPRYRELVATLEHYWVDTALKVPRHLRRALVERRTRLTRFEGNHSDHPGCVETTASRLRWN